MTSSTDDSRQPTGIPDSAPDTDPTFPITLDRKMAWIIQQVVHPGMPFPKTDQTMALPAFRWQEYALALRWKVNTAILQFEDEEDTKEVEFVITEAEGWILDQSVPFDGDAGGGGRILVQVFRGMWHLRMDEIGSTLPHQLVPYPKPIPAEENPGNEEPVQPPTLETFLLDTDENKDAGAA